MATYKEWIKKDSLEKFWNGVHLKDKEREDFEIRGCRRLQQEWEIRELKTWNGSTEMGGEEKLNKNFRHRNIRKHQEPVYK